MTIQKLHRRIGSISRSFPNIPVFERGKTLLESATSAIIGQFYVSTQMKVYSTAMERSLVLLKPDCVQRRLVGTIISRFEEKAINIIAMKLIQVTPELSKQHYAEHVEKPFYPGLEAFITGAPVVAMVVEGLEVIRVVREMLGATNGLKAAAGTIRGRFQQ